MTSMHKRRKASDAESLPVAYTTPHFGHGTAAGDRRAIPRNRQRTVRLEGVGVGQGTRAGFTEVVARRPDGS